jgi:hypothetical protein
MSLVPRVFHQAPAGLDEALPHAGHLPAVDALGQHQPPPQLGQVLRQDTQLQAGISVLGSQTAGTIYQTAASWTVGVRFFAPVAVPTKNSVLTETVEFAQLRCVGCQSHVYSLRLYAFLRASLLPNSGSSAS